MCLGPQLTAASFGLEVIGTVSTAMIYRNDTVLYQNKSSPVRGHAGPEGARMLWLLDF